MSRFNRLDIMEAYLCFAYYGLDYFDIDIMSRLARLKFKPRSCLNRSPKCLTKNGKAIYMRLVKNYYITRAEALKNAQ